MDVGLSFGSPGTARWRIFINSTFLIWASFLGSVVLALEVVPVVDAGADVDGKCFDKSARAASFFAGPIDSDCSGRQACDDLCLCLLWFYSEWLVRMESQDSHYAEGLVASGTYGR